MVQVIEALNDLSRGTACHAPAEFRYVASLLLEHLGQLLEEHAIAYVVLTGQGAGLGGSTSSPDGIGAGGEDVHAGADAPVCLDVGASLHSS
jgi:hypothetical protein